MDLTYRELPRVVEIRVCALSGTDINTFPRSFHDLAERLRLEGHRFFLVDLDTKFINSVGLGAIILAYSELDKEGGDLAIYSHHASMMQLFRSLKCPPIFFDDRNQALCHLLRDRRQDAASR